MWCDALPWMHASNIFSLLRQGWARLRNGSLGKGGSRRSTLLVERRRKAYGLYVDV